MLRKPFNNDESKAGIHIGRAVFSHDCFQIGRRDENQGKGCTVFQRNANVDVIIAAVGELRNLRWIKMEYCT